LLLAARSPLAAQDSFKNVERIVAVGDVHGGFDEMVTILRGAKVIDDSNKWIAGKTHLVQTGDILDRGPDSRKVMDLLMELEKQAQKAGGRVHSLIGNHEAMNLYGDLRYVSPAEYAAFRGPDSEAVRDRYFKRILERAEKGRGSPADMEAFRQKWYAEHPLGWVEHRMAFDPDGQYGRWLNKKNAVVQINDMLFVHGGISPKYAKTSRGDFNRTIRDELTGVVPLEGGMAVDPLGPLWYRGLAQGPEENLAAHVDSVLQKHGVNHIVIGHTPTGGVVTPRFAGKVILIDTGLSKYYGGNLSCLIVEGGKFLAWHRGNAVPFPADGANVEAYYAALGVTPGQNARRADP
jgi:hypothetical protein